MDVFSVLTALGGLSLFLYGMYLLEEGLPRIAGGRMERALGKAADSPGRAVFIGVGITVLLQSSSAATVMVVGLVDAGLMELHQALGVIMGANIGTCATAWILGMAGISSDSLPVRMLRPTSFAPILGMAGVLILLSSAGKKYREKAMCLMGFSILLFGMDTMCRAAEPLADMPGAAGMLTRLSDPLAGVAAGAALTALIQSSSAAVGMLQAAGAAGAIDYRTAIPLILGMNIGTCATALLSGIGAGKNAKRAALLHLYFNGIGTVLFLTGCRVALALFPLPFLSEPISGLGVAWVHSIFNISTTLALLPFSGGLVKLACLAVREDAPGARVGPLRARQRMRRGNTRRDPRLRG